MVPIVTALFWPLWSVSKHLSKSSLRDYTYSFSKNMFFDSIEAGTESFEILRVSLDENSLASKYTLG